MVARTIKSAHLFASEAGLCRAVVFQCSSKDIKANVPHRKSYIRTKESCGCKRCKRFNYDVTPILRQYEVEGYDAINIEMYMNASITGGYIFPKQGCYLCSANRHQATVPANPAIPVAASITILIKPSSEPVRSRTGIVQGK